MPIGLQTCAKVLQMRLPGGGGTPWLQPKNNQTFKLVSAYPRNYWLLTLYSNSFIIVANVPTGLQTCATVLQMHLPGGRGTPSLQPKKSTNFKLGFYYIFKCLAVGFAFKYFHYSCHCAHRVANLCKSTANAPSRGWGDTFVATQKKHKFQNRAALSF